MKKLYTKIVIACMLSAIISLLTNITSAQTLSTDKPDYPPGDTVIITGTGFLAGETVTMQVLHADGGGDNDSSAAHLPWDITADENGNLATIWVVPPDEDEGGAALVGSASGQTSGLYIEVDFTDAICPPITISSNPTGVLSCASQPVSFSVSASSAAPGALTFKWRKNGGIITGATSSSFTISSVSASDAGNYDVVVTNSCGGTKASTVATLTINNVNGGSIAADQTIQIGGDPSILSSLVNGSGAGTITYQWEESSDNIYWTSIAGATTASYDPGALSEDEYYHRMTTSTLNNVSCTAVSNLVIVVVNNVTAGSISTSQMIYSGQTPATLESISNGYGDGTISYRWQTSTDAIHWTDISGATDVSYSPEALSQTTYFRRIASSSLSGVVSEDVSNDVIITVIPCSTVTSSFSASACNSYALPWGGSVTASGNYSHTYSTSHGCDSVVTASVTIYNSAASSFSASACNSYALPWGGSVTASGNYSHTYATAHGCDSVVTASVTIYNSAASSFNASACNSYALPWGGSVTASGNYSHTYATAHGCDSVVTASVTIYNSAASSFSASACNSYALPWGGSVTASGNYSHTYATAHGCDSVVTASVTIYNSAASSFSALACNSYALPWGGSVTASGNYSHTYATAHGCDSVVTASVTIYNSAASSFSASACNSYALPWGGSVTASGNYSHTYATAHGCDSVVTASVTIYNSAASSFSALACNSYALPWGGSVTASGNYSHTYATAHGCDSVVTASVTIYNSAASSFSASACNSYALPWGGSVTASGNYSHTYSTSHGCDSVVTANVTIYNSAASSFSASACNSYALPWGANVTTSGNYSHTYATVHGCDSVVTTNVTIYNSAASSFSASACNSYALPWGGNVTASGNYSHTYSTVNGCDSVVTANVSIYNSAASSFSASACNSYALPWGGNVTASGNYSHTYATAHGCDSVVTANVTIYNSAASSFNASACDSYTLPWSGTVTSSGNYSHTYTTLHGCDSVVTANVTINNSTSSSFNATACNSYTLPWGGSATASGNYSHTYSTSHGCDSVVTANVTIYNSTASSFSASACNSYALPWGDNVTASGNYSHTYSTSHGCDSVVTANVAIYNSAASSFSASACNSYALPWGGNVTASGNYSHTYATSHGCDSVVTTNVTIYNSAASSFSASACNSYALPWGGSVTASGNYSHTYATAHGCDSVVTANVSIYNSTASSFSASACNNYTLPWGGNVTASGNYSHTYSTSHGCDSVVTASVTIYNSAASSFNASACNSYTLPWGGSVTASGNYSHTYSTIHGCDSAVTANVTIYNSAASSFNASACNSYSLPWGDVVATSGNYSHTYATSHGCDSVVTAHVTINSNPSVSITGNNSICSGSTTFDAGSGYSSYLWSTGATTQTISVITAGTYSVTVSTSGGCSGSATRTLTVSSNPTVTISATCAQASVTFDAGPGYTSYLWSTGETTQTISATAAGTYSVTVTNAGGCTATASKNLVVNACGPITHNAYTDFNSSANAGVATTLWLNIHTKLNSSTSLGANGDSIVFSTGTITLTNITASPSVTNTVIPKGKIVADNTVSAPTTIYNASANEWITRVPVGYVSSDIFISGAIINSSNGFVVSSGKSSSVTGAWKSNKSGFTSSWFYGLATYQTQFSYSDVSGSNQVLPITTGGLKPGTPTTKTGNLVAGGSGGGGSNYTGSYSSTDNYTACQINFNVIPVASSNTPVIYGNNLNLTSGGGVSYAWSGPNGYTSTQQNATISGTSYLTAGTYTVIVTNANGCTASASTPVTMTCTGFKSYTVTQGGWGASPNGNNPAVYRNANFPYAFPAGLTIGNGPYYLYLTSAQAVQDFLPSGGTPAALTATYTNPGSSLSNTLAGQLAALALNIGFDLYDASFAPATTMHLKDMFIKSGPFIGWTVNQVYNEAMLKLGGGSSAYTAAQLNTACTNINQNYDGGTTDAGFLSCTQFKMENRPSDMSLPEVKLFPNPNNGIFRVELDLFDGENTSAIVQVMNMLGQIVYLDKADVVDGSLEYNVNLDEKNVPSGAYLVQIICDNQVYIKRALYQR